MINWNNTLSKIITTLLYMQIQKLLYYNDIKKSYCLCIFTYLYEEVFMLAHDVMKHLNYNYIHEWLTDNFYLLNISKHLYNFIWHCLQCQNIQTLQHCFYELMQFIFTSLQLFYIFTINFILVLLISSQSDNYNMILSIIDKFSKTVMFISEWKIMTVKNWVIYLLNCLILLNWDLL